MELDDLKKEWNKPAHSHPAIDDLTELIRDKQYGPVASLKKAFTRRIRFMMIIPLVLIVANVEDWSKVLSNIIFWFYVIFCVAVVIYAYLNYRVVQRMESMDSIVKTNLERQISILETRMKWNTRGIKMALLFFIILAEVVPYIQPNRMLEKWHALNPLIRFGTYTAVILVQHFASKKIHYRRFNRHLDYLKDLVKQMQP